MDAVRFTSFLYGNGGGSTTVQNRHIHRTLIRTLENRKRVSKPADSTVLGSKPGTSQLAHEFVSFVGVPHGDWVAEQGEYGLRPALFKDQRSMAVSRLDRHDLRRILP
jgi:hypothetical protein